MVVNVMATALRGDASGEKPSLLQLRDNIIRMVAGLDRGFGGTLKSAQMIDSAVLQLQREAGPVCFSSFRDSDMADSAGERDEKGLLISQNLMAGKWRLIYSSAFTTGNGLQGERGVGPPGFPAFIKLRQIYQTIDLTSRRLDNIVTFSVSPFIPVAFSSFEQASVVMLSLSHSLKVISKAGLEIEFIGTHVKIGDDQLSEWLGISPEIDVPLPNVIRMFTDNSTIRSSTFTTVYLDEMTRITRGDRRELRVYTKES